MPTFSYTIRTDQGSSSRGRLEATSLNEAILKVRKLGGIPLEVKEIRGGRAKSGGKLRGGISLKDRIIFSEQLAVMLNAGITLIQALKGQQEEAINKTLSNLLVQVIADVEGGLAFSAALAKHPRVFSSIYCEMIKAAEKTGNLADALNKLTVQQQKEYELRGKVAGALIYPTIVLILLTAVIIIVITFILPKLSGLFAEAGNQLPASTRFLLALSNFMVTKWFILVGVIIGLIAGFRFLVSRPKGRLFWDTYKLKIPVLGSFSKKAYMARFSQSFASLAKAGVPVLEVFQTLKGVIGNALYEVEIEKIARDVENGIKVSTAIRKSKHFPPMIGQLVSVGEQSGDLAGIFEVLGAFFEKEVDSMAKNLSTLLEPIIMIAMGVGIGFVLISVLQPIYGLVNQIN